MKRYHKIHHYRTENPYAFVLIKHVVIFCVGVGAIFIMGLILFLMPYIAFIGLLVFLVKSFMNDWSKIHQKNRDNEVIDVEVDR